MAQDLKSEDGKHLPSAKLEFHQTSDFLTLAGTQVASPF